MDGGIAHEDVDTSEAGDGVGDEPLGLVRVTDVAGYDGMAASGKGRRHRRRCARGAAAVHGDHVAAGGESRRDGGADPPGAAGNQHPASGLSVRAHHQPHATCGPKGRPSCFGVTTVRRVVFGDEWAAGPERLVSRACGCG
jgi:hypothetical protein